MTGKIRRFVREAPMMVWLIVGVFVLDFYLLALESVTRRRQPYRLTPRIELKVAAVGRAFTPNQSVAGGSDGPARKPSPFGEPGRPRATRRIAPVADRHGVTMLPGDEQRLTQARHVAVTGSLEGQN